MDLLAKESEAVASELFNVNEDMDVQALQDEVRLLILHAAHPCALPGPSCTHRLGATRGDR